MVLLMPSPFKHPSTGVYWLRQRTPVDVKSLAKGQIVHLTLGGIAVRRTVGEELIVSLFTKDPSEAKQRAIDALAQFSAIWTAFRNPPATLSFKDIVALAGEAFRAFQSMEDNPARPEVWRNVLEVNRAALMGKTDGPFIGTTAQRRRAALQRRFGPFVDVVLKNHHRKVDDETYEQLLEQVGKALTDAAELLLKRSEGDYSPDSRGEKYPAVVRPHIGSKSRSGRLTFGALIAHKDKTQDRSPKTIAVYKSKLADFAAFIGHDDPLRVTKDDVRRWRDEQARTILAATFGGVRKNVSLPYRRAIFWVPWICAYTGLRVGEVTQLQGSSLRSEGGIPDLIIRPEDGGTKGGNAWTTGFHQHLIDLGLLEMLREIGDGPAFYAPYAPDVDMTKVRRHRSKDAADRVADWVREEVGIVAPLGRPNHAWRHAFTTASRACKMDKEARDYMMGSRSQTDAREGYGDWTPTVISAEINKLPRFKVIETDWRPSTERAPVAELRGSTPTKRVRRPPNRREKAA